MSDTSPDQLPPPPEAAEAEAPEMARRRLLLRSLGRWSGAVIATACVGRAEPAQAQGGSWINRRGGGGWVNRAGGSWVNRSGGWVNRSGGWLNHGGGWINRRMPSGGSWINRF